MNYFYALVAVFGVSLLSLFGVFFLVLRRKTFETIIHYFLAFSSGVLLGAVFFDLLPKATEEVGENASIMLIVGMILSFALEKIINWHHCALGEECKGRPAAILSLIGDSIHNFIDGAIIAIAFLTSISLGITTTIAVVGHEIPHELGDFSILIYGGFSNRKALWYNFLTGLTAVAGAIFIFLAGNFVTTASAYLVGAAAGNFLYIAASDLIPELHTKRHISASIIQTLLIIIGVVLMFFLVKFLSE